MNVVSQAMPLSEDELREYHAKHSKEANEIFTSQGFDFPDGCYQRKLLVFYLNS